MRRPVEIFDEFGRLRGTFRPAVFAACPIPEVPFTEEEVRLAGREMEEGKFFTPAQVLEHLKRLGQELDYL